MIWYLVLIPLLVYVCLVIWFIKGWVGIRELGIRNQELGIMVSVIIPCRNEANTIQTILKSLDQQKFDFKNLEVIIVDDHSTDDTLGVITNYELRIRNFKPLVVKLSENEFGKKSAINKALKNTIGELIVCTDADCEFGVDWLSIMTSAFHSSEIKMVTGPIMFFERPGFWNQMMQLEFLSLIGIGAASVQNSHPNMCNGANIAYRKSAFYEVNGFEGNEHIPSGDDEFLMHKIYDKFHGGVQFVKNHEAIVYTEPPQNFNEFVNQRIRWGSKAGHYKSFKSKLLPAFMYLFNVMLFLTPVFYFVGMSWTLIATLWLAKLSIEIAFFASILPFFRSSKILDLVIPAQIFHVVYISVIGVLSVVKNYNWKGR